MRRITVFIILSLISLTVSCRWDLGYLHGMDTRVRSGNSEMISGSVDVVREKVQKMTPVDPSEEEQENQRVILEQLDFIDERATDEKQRAEVRRVEEGYDPGWIDPMSDEANDAFNRYVGYAGARQARRDANPFSGRKAGETRKTVSSWLWDLLPWWLKGIIIGLTLSTAYAVYLRVRVSIKLAKANEQMQAAEQNLKEEQRKASELARRNEERKAALVEVDQWIEDHVPEAVRQKLVKLPNLRREHIEINNERKADMSKWAKDLLGDGILTDEESRILKEHLHNLSEEAQRNFGGITRENPPTGS